MDFKNPVLPEHEPIFWAAVRKWQRKLNLDDWEINDYTHDTRTKRSSTNMAEIYKIEPQHRMARLRLGLDFGQTPVTPASLERLAAHELLHLRLYLPLKAAADECDIFADSVTGEEHSAIMALLNALLGPNETRSDPGRSS